MTPPNSGVFNPYGDVFHGWTTEAIHAWVAGLFDATGRIYLRKSAVVLTVEARDPDPTKPDKSFSSADHVHVEIKCR